MKCEGEKSWDCDPLAEPRVTRNREKDVGVYNGMDDMIKYVLGIPYST